MVTTSVELVTDDVERTHYKLRYSEPGLPASPIHVARAVVLAAQHKGILTARLQRPKKLGGPSTRYAMRVDCLMGHTVLVDKTQYSVSRVPAGDDHTDDYLLVTATGFEQTISSGFIHIEDNRGYAELI